MPMILRTLHHSQRPIYPHRHHLLHQNLALGHHLSSTFMRPLQCRAWPPIHFWYFFTLHLHLSQHHPRTPQPHPHRLSPQSHLYPNALNGCDNLGPALTTSVRKQRNSRAPWKAEKISPSLKHAAIHIGNAQWTQNYSWSKIMKRGH